METLNALFPVDEDDGFAEEVAKLIHREYRESFKGTKKRREDYPPQVIYGGVDPGSTSKNFQERSKDLVRLVEQKLKKTYGFSEKKHPKISKIEAGTWINDADVVIWTGDWKGRCVVASCLENQHIAPTLPARFLCRTK